MDFKEKFASKFKEFKPTSWVIDHKTVTYVATLVITLWGLNIFTTLPKESYPDIVIPQIYVSTVYAGTSPKDMEELVTRPIEKQIKGITGARIRNVKNLFMVSRFILNVVVWFIIICQVLSDNLFWQ